MKKQNTDIPQDPPEIGVEDPAVEAPAAPPESVPDALTHLQAENAELKAAVRLGQAREQVTGVLRTAGARSPQLLFEAARDSLQIADDGAVVNTAAIVEQMRRDFPEQFWAGDPHVSIDGGAGRAAIPPLTRDALARMSPAEIARLDWAVVRQVLAGGK